jgi:hypothetical protein
MVVDDKETTYGSGWYNLDGVASVNIFYSSSGSINLVVAANSDKYDGVMLTGCYENASPSTSNPSAITLAGLTLDVNQSAQSTIRSFAVGDRITVVLNTDGEVATVYDIYSKSVEMVGILGNNKVTLTNGLVLSGTVSGSAAVGTLVTVNSGTAGKLSVQAASSTNSLTLLGEDGTLGSTELADDAAIYEHVGTSGTAVRISLSDIHTATVSGGSIDYVHKNSSGQADVLLLDDVTGNLYTYGVIKRTVTTKTGSTDLESSEKITVSVTNGDGTSDEYAYSGSQSTSGWVGGIAISSDGEVTGMAILTKATGISRSSFYTGDDDQEYVKVSGGQHSGQRRRPGLQLGYRGMDHAGRGESLFRYADRLLRQDPDHRRAGARDLHGVKKIKEGADASFRTSALFIIYCLLCFYQGFPHGVDIARTHGEDEVAGRGDASQIVGQGVQRLEVAGAGAPLSQVSGGNSDGIVLPRGINFGQKGHVGLFQHPDEIVEERLGAGIGVGLKGADYPAVAKPPGGIQKRLEFPGVVGVIVVHLGAAAAALMLKAPAGAPEDRQPLLHRPGGDAQADAGGGGGQGVFHIVYAGDAQLHMGEAFAPVYDVEGGQPPLPG